MSEVVTVYGRSDDQIVVTGDVEQVFYPPMDVERDDGMLIALSCGVLLRVKFDGDWVIRPVSDEPNDVFAAVEHSAAHNHDHDFAGDYTDVVAVEAESIAWAALAKKAVVRGGDD